MKKFMRILSAVLATVMLFSVTVFAADTDTSQSTTTATLSDIDPSTVEGKAVTELMKLGIINGYDDGTYKPNNTVTRGEMAKIITCFKGIDDIATDTLPSGFSDVDDINHWAKKYIKLASDQKIVVGYEDGTFRPDADVTYVQVVKMIVCALNYGVVAESKQQEGAPWYQGYMTVATEKGITKNVKVNNQEDPASRGTVAVLVYNALNVEVANVSASGNVTISTGGGSSSGGGSGRGSGSSGGKTALEELGKEEVDGVVTAVYQTGLKSGSTGLLKRNIIVETKEGEVEYQVDKTVDTYSLLGRHIEAYAEEAEFADEADVLSEITKSKKNTTTAVALDLIDEITASSITFYPDEESKKKTVRFASDMVVIYNGKLLPSYTVDTFKNIKSGNIVFICNDNDAEAEVAFVTSYKLYVVNSYDKKSDEVKIYSMYDGGTLTIPSEEDGNYIFSLTREGSEISAASITKWDVISVLTSDETSEGKAVWKGIVTRQKVSSKIKAISGDVLTIGNKDYVFSYIYEEYTGTKPTLDVNMTPTMYLDHEGKIAAVNTTSTSATASTYLGYLIYAEKEDGIDGKGRVQLYGVTGTTKERLLQLADKVTIDGVQESDVSVILDKLKASSAEANKTKDTDGDGIYDVGVELTPYAQMIRYTLNESKEVEEIDTVMPNKTEAEDDLVQSLPFPYAGNTRDDKTFYYAASGKFVKADGISTQILVNSTTKVLTIPESVDDIDNIKIKTYSGAFTKGKYYRIEAYNVNAVDVAKYVVVYTGNGEEEFTEEAPFVLTSSVATKNTEDGPVDSFTGWTLKGTEKSGLLSASAGMLSGYSKGDIFTYLTNSDGAVKKVKTVLKIVNGVPVLCYDREVGAENYDRLRSLETAEEARSERIFMVDDITRTPSNSYNYFYFGTVIGRVDEVIKVNNTLSTDKNGIYKDAASETFTLDVDEDSPASSNTKVYLYDSKATKEEDRLTSGVSLDNIKSYVELEEAGANVNDASKVLIYTSINAVKTVIIFK